MTPAKSIAILTLATLLLSVFLPLTAFAANEVHVSISKNQTISITGDQEKSAEQIADDLNAELSARKAEMKLEELKIRQRVQESNPPETATPSPTASESLRIKNTPTPTKVPSSTPTPQIRRHRTPTPTKTPSPTPTKKVTPTPTTQTTATATPSPTASDEKQVYIMNAINAYRKSLGLSTVKTDPYTCNFAKERAREITNAFNHDGFRNRINNDTLPYPNYSQVTENLAMTSNYKNVVTMWINSPGHAENMRRDTPFVCVESSGNYYAYEGWRP